MVTDILIIGGGAAGLFSAASAVIFSKKSGTKIPSIIVAEKNERCGKKIAITGKGRCNLTNTKSWNEFSTHIYPDRNFFKPSFFEMSNTDTMKVFEDIGLPLTIERGDRVFPASMKSMDVVNVLISFLKKNGVRIINNFCVKKITNEHSICDASQCSYNFKVENQQGDTILSKYLLIATGGLSYPLTGSSGDGYVFAKKLGHKITPCFPSLTALIPKNYQSMGLQGISLKNVNIYLIVNEKIIQTEFGDLDFTNDGIEGPIGFKISRKAVYNIINGQKVSVIIDFKPAVNITQLEARVRKESNGIQNISMNIFLLNYLPKQLISPFIDIQKPLTINNLPDKLKNFRLNITDYVGYRRSVITAGGVDIKEVSQKTMQSKILKDLYFAGEILNLDADTGGYNLQIAFSTGALAAKSILKNFDKQNK